MERFVEKTISNLRKILEEAMIRSARDAKIFLVEAQFSSDMKNGGRNPQSLLTYSVMLQRELRAMEVVDPRKWIDLFQKTILIQSNVLDFLRRNPPLSHFLA